MSITFLVLQQEPGASALKLSLGSHTRKTAGFVMLVLASACGPATFAYSPRLPKSGVRVARGSQAAVFEKCGGTSLRKDDGEPVTFKDDVVACWSEVDKTIYAEDSCRGAKAAAIHERAHEEGIADPEKAGYGWE